VARADAAGLHDRGGGAQRPLGGGAQTGRRAVEGPSGEICPCRLCADPHANCPAAPAWVVINDGSYSRALRSPNDRSAVSMAAAGQPGPRTRYQKGAPQAGARFRRSCNLQSRHAAGRAAGAGLCPKGGCKPVSRSSSLSKCDHPHKTIQETEPRDGCLHTRANCTHQPRRRRQPPRATASLCAEARPAAHAAAARPTLPGMGAGAAAHALGPPC
jgi:hypothetical protein